MQPAHFQHIKPDIIDSLCPGVYAVQLTVLTEYLKIRQADIERLAQALSEDRDRRELAHRMKSQFQLVGADAIAQLCQQLETPEPLSLGEHRRVFQQIIQLESEMAIEVTRLINILRRASTTS